MSREIKFRAWDKINNKWFSQSGDFRFKEYPCLIAIGLHGLPISVSEDSFKNDEVIGWNRDHNIEIMQYTGLKDKNGVEIYEGDIVAHPYKFGNGKGQVTFWNGAFKLESKNGTCDEILFIECEVIGNIYENPELLT